VAEVRAAVHPTEDVSPENVREAMALKSIPRPARFGWHDTSIPSTDAALERAAHLSSPLRLSDLLAPPRNDQDGDSYIVNANAGVTDADEEMEGDDDASDRDDDDRELTVL